MAGFVVRLDALDFATIDDALARVRTAIDAGRQLSIDPRDPTALLGDLGRVIQAVQHMDVDSSELGRLGRVALDALGGLIELPDLGALDGIVEGVAEMVALVTQLATVLSTHGADGRQLIDRVLTTVGGTSGLADLLEDVTARAAAALGVQIPDELTAPLRALGKLGAGGAVAASELAGILSTMIVGLDVGEMSRLTSSTDAALRLVAGAGNSAQLEAAIAVVRDRVATTYELIDVGGTIALDVDAVLDSMVQIGVALDVLGGIELPRFVSGMAADLRSVQNQLGELDLAAAAEKLFDALPLPGEDIPRVMVDSLRDLAEVFESMTGEALTSAFASLAERLGGGLPLGTLGDLLTGIDDAFEFLGRQVEGLPIRSVRDQIVSALIGAQQRILAFDGFDFLDDVVAPVRTLEAKVRDIDLGAITGGVQGVVDTVNGLFDDFPIDDLRDAVDAVIDPLGAIVADLTPFVQQIADQLEALVAELEKIDFDAAGAATLDLMHGIRTQVQDAVGGGNVPEPVKAVIAGAAAILGQMDLAVELTAPFDSAMVSIDVESLLAPITEVWEAAGAALRRATPAALIGELDPPFEQLLATIDKLSLAPLIHSVGDVFAGLVKKLEAVDPRRLVAPLEQAFQDLLATLRTALDPAPLFEPLRDVYAALRGLVDQIDIEAFVTKILGGLVEVPGGLTQAVGDRLTAQGGGGAAAAQLPAVTVPFRFGDPLRPLAAFVAEIRGRLQKLTNDTVGAALSELAAATRGLRALADPVTGFAARVGDALDARLQLTDPRSGEGPLAELRAELEALGGAVAQLEVDAGAQARLSAAGASVQFDARVRVDVAAMAELQTHGEAARASADSPGLGRSVRLLARSLDAALPPELLTSSTDPTANVAGFLDAVFSRFDPAPLVADLDAIGDRIQARLAALTNELTLGVYRIWNQLFAGLEPLLPARIIARVQAGLDGLFAHLDVLDPAAIETEAGDVVSAAISLLDVHSPAKLAAGLGAVFDAAIDQVRALDPAALFAGLDPFAGVRTRLEAMRPSLVLAPIVDRAASFSTALETIAAIDLTFVVEIVARIKATFAKVLAGVEAEWSALLDELGSISGGVSASVSVG